MTTRIAIIGALDTKGVEFAFLRDQIQRQGVETLVVNIGVIGEPGFAPDIGAAEVARAAGAELAQLREEHDRGQAMATMARGAAEVARRLHAEGRIDGVIGMGGSGNITVMPSIVDVAGLNRVSRQIFSHAAGAIVGMARAAMPAADDRPILAASMFGNTTT